MKFRTFKCLLALAGAACLAAPATAGEFDPRERGKYGDLPPTLAVELDAPGAVRAELRVSLDPRREPQVYVFDREDGELSGGIHVPLGEKRRIGVLAFDSNGEVVYKGEGTVYADEKLTPEIDVALEGRNAELPGEARFGSHLLTAVTEPAHEGDGLMLRLSVIDPLGGHVPFTPEDLEWRLPEGFPTLPYSCFNNSLCILEWKPTIEQHTKYICLKLKQMLISCVKPQPDPRGPYLQVAVGRNHTCAITKDQTVHCWGDNVVGQLGAPGKTTCGLRTCSLTPTPVVCPPNESCRFTALTAGGNHTCAIDTNKKAWCWGEDGEATGLSSFNSLPPETHRQLPTLLETGFVQWAAIDTNVGHTCGLTSNQDVYCWGGNNSGELGTPTSQVTNTPRPTLVRTGNKYQAVSTGSMHSCAIQVNGLADCWGDNRNFQLTGNSNSSLIITINPKVPLLNGKLVRRVATGESTTCVQTSHDDTVCWGKPAASALPTNVNPGFVALHASSATSLATEIDDCNGFGNCTQTCLTESFGDLRCGIWRTGIATPAPLALVTDPKDDYSINWTQVDVGPNHTCAVTTQRDVWCWGRNDFGQFGIGSMTFVETFEPKTKAVR